MNVSQLQRDRDHILSVSGDLWEALRGERIFVTGGTGFVGMWLMEAFSAANAAFELGADVVLLTRDPSRFRTRSPHLASDPAITLLEGDLRSFDPPAGEFTFAIHAATTRAFPADRDRPLGLLGDDFAATRGILDFAASRRVRRFLFTSSGAVYGRDAASLHAISEDYSGSPDVTDASATYGVSKRLSEFACISYARVFGFEASIARLFAFVGPYLPMDEGYAVGNFLGDVLAGRTIAIGGDGTPRRSYLYAADLAVWLWTILLRGVSGRAYNVGSPAGLSVRELALLTASTLAPGIAVSVGTEALPGAAPSGYVPDTSRAQRELGLRVTIDLPEGLRRTHAFNLESKRTGSIS